MDRSSQAFAVRKTGKAIFCNWKTKPQLDSCVNYYTGKIRHPPTSLLASSKKNLMYEHGDLIWWLKMSVKGFAELCGVVICVHVLVIFLCYYNAEHSVCLSVYVNITVTCSTLQCNQEYLKKFINYSCLFSLSDLTFSANSSGDPRAKHNTSSLFIQSLLA